jgi:hypothetical protein
MAILLTRMLKPMLLARHARACPGHPRLTAFARRKAWMAGTSSAKTRFALLPGHGDLKTSQKNGAATAYAASAALAFSAIAWNAAGSVMARSDSTLRSTVMPDFDRPLIKTL